MQRLGFQIDVFMYKYETVEKKQKKNCRIDILSALKQSAPEIDHKDELLLWLDG